MEKLLDLFKEGTEVDDLPNAHKLLLTDGRVTFGTTCYLFI
jgi:ABC-type transport system involved in Fe-S cluster assembly fused permease/ATPase subunit